MGNPPFSVWQREHPEVQLLTLPEAASSGEVTINATSGTGSLDALAAAESGLADKVLVDVANPLDFSHGFPPTLSVVNTDSLAEQIQQKFPRARVVKALNTMTASVMINPLSLSGDHNVFLAGEDGAAKEIVRKLLNDLGWKDENVVDLGGIQAARGAEMYLPLWLTLMGKLGPNFNIKIVEAAS